MTSLQRVRTLEDKLAGRHAGKTEWRPVNEQQALAYHSAADVLFFGGRAGSGKTFLLLGLAGTGHRKSIIFRRQFTAMLEIETIGLDLFGLDCYRRQRRRWEMAGRSIELGAVSEFGAERAYAGRPHDLKGFDEISQFTERQFRYLCGWMRTPDPDQRCRVVCTGNPPESEDGDWVIRYWGPWLDPDHPRPAEPGELRWFTSVDGKDQECSASEQIESKDGSAYPMSRTYIPGIMVDAYRKTGYETTLQALPEPLRSQLLYGDFTARRSESAMQVIPAAWADLAIRRWQETARPGMRMSALGCDPARGGRDATVIAMRYGSWYDEVVSLPGGATPDGGTVAALCLHYRDCCPVHVDVIGIGSSVLDALRDADVPSLPLNGAAGSDGCDRSGMIRFANKRAQWWWEMREALDPDHGSAICLPPDAELRADLCAPRWTLRGGRLAIEPKEKIIERLGRSPDKGDAVIYALAETAIVPFTAQDFANNRGQSQAREDGR